MMVSEMVTTKVTIRRAIITIWPADAPAAGEDYDRFGMDANEIASVAASARHV